MKMMDTRKKSARLCRDPVSRIPHLQNPAG